jgi:uncharacterized protein (TIGR02453 family)
MTNTQFSGFHPLLLQFLDELASHNNRDWFNKNKSRYENDLLEPALGFIEAMRKPLAGISPHFLAVPKRVGGSLMRIYRDTRFAKDKSPYKTNVGIQFRHARGKDVHAPGFYVHIEPDQCFVGCGIWHPDSTTLAKIRKTIAKDPAGWKRATRGKAFRRDFNLAGDALKRPPQGFDADHPLIDDLKRKDFIAVAPLEMDALFELGLVKDITTKMRTCKPLVRYLCESIRLPF